jgi:hypothetical protein
MELMPELTEVSSAPERLVFAKVAARATVPPSRPVKAAVSTRELFEIFMTFSPL